MRTLTLLLTPDVDTADLVKVEEVMDEMGLSEAV